MTTCLFSSMIMETGADRMAQVDPHGWTLTVISICVVFAALVILYFLYSLSGKLFSGQWKLGKKAARGAAAKADEAEIAAAIALTLQAECGGESEAAAIAMALHLHFTDSVHDIEPGIVTIVRSSTEWDNKARNFRKSPVK